MAALHAVRAAFWLGLASLALGVAAGVTTRFRATADHSRTLAWLGIALGASAVVLSIVREECGFTFPFAGSAASLLSLALIVFCLGAARVPGSDRGEPPPGFPGARGQGQPPGGQPPDGRGGPPGERGRGRPRPPAPSSELLGPVVRSQGRRWVHVR